MIEERGDSPSVIAGLNPAIQELARLDARIKSTAVRLRFFQA
jgi:hypothetical protein